MKNKTITVTFKENEQDLYTFVKKQRNYSAFLKDLIDAAMTGNVFNTGVATPVVPVIEPVKEEKQGKNTTWDDF